MKIALFAMTSKGFAVLETLYGFSPKSIAFVVSARDSATDDDYFSVIEQYCVSCSIPFYHRSDSPSLIGDLVVAAVSWRWMIKHSSIPLIIFHDSILPRCRGFNPLVTALINGDSQIGVTMLYASSEYDAGDIIAQSVSDIVYPITILEAIKLIHGNYKILAGTLAEHVEFGALPEGKPQVESEATYSLWRDDQDYVVDWAQSSEKIERFVDSVGPPYKGALSYINNQPVRILSVCQVCDVLIENRTSGKVLFLKKGLPVVVCGRGLLLIRDMISEDTGASLLPVLRMRTKFTSWPLCRPATK
ncbi:MAG: methionyl-tRNA formyltransferase [Polynucleobacter sp.]|nr:methionyl-tRNA formyltransferase [Polynucleobacter sp.]